MEPLKVELEDFSPVDATTPSLVMDFGAAVRELVNGHRVTRIAWDDPTIFLVVAVLEKARETENVPSQPYLCISKDGVPHPLCVSLGDLAGDDWVLV